jgi:16S rRNA (uracil1498-N3)-methyltransferase
VTTPLRRFWIPPGSVEGRRVRISGEVLHHLRDVCRLRAGSAFEALAGDGRALSVEITSIDAREAVGHVTGERAIPGLPRPHLHLALCVPRFPVLDAIVERAVELGVATLTPLVSDHSFVRGAGALTGSRRARHEKIVRSATQQCGRGELMRVLPPLELTELLRHVPAAVGRQGIFAFEGAGGAPLHDVLARVRAARPEDVWIFVGSEGGFSAREVAAFREHGLDPATLGTRVLRVETACIALVSIVGHELRRESGP